MNMINLKVQQKRIGPILGRHPWVFSGALVNIPDKIESGTPVNLIDENDVFLASGYFSSYSQISVRIWSFDEKEEVNHEFFVRRVQKASDTRNNYLGKDTNAYRLINSENDFLPGLIVDKYADYLVVQCHTRGIEKWKDEIVKALVEVVNPKGIYEKSDAAGRKVEELEEQTGILFGEVPEKIEILENGLKFYVDVINGQKTGFFLDQRDKRKALMKYVEGKKVLNCFSYTGGFSVYALAGGAEKVTSVDISESAINMAKENVKLNGFDENKVEFVCADVKDYLRNLKPGQFDVIILDPPAFIKDRHKVKEGLRGYKGINEAALRSLQENTLLVSCSCSTHLKYEDFRYLLSECGGRTRKSLQFLEIFTYGLDHPVLVPFVEGEYLKTFFMKVN